MLYILLALGYCNTYMMLKCCCYRIRIIYLTLTLTSQDRSSTKYRRLFINTIGLYYEGNIGASLFMFPRIQRLSFCNNKKVYLKMNLCLGLLNIMSIFLLTICDIVVINGVNIAEIQSQKACYLEEGLVNCIF